MKKRSFRKRSDVNEEDLISLIDNAVEWEDKVQISYKEDIGLVIIKYGDIKDAKVILQLKNVFGEGKFRYYFKSDYFNQFSDEIINKLRDVKIDYEETRLMNLNSAEITIAVEYKCNELFYYV